MAETALSVTNQCLDCGATLESAQFCPECGQERTEKLYSLRELAGHYAEDFFTIDSKLLRSLSPLLLRPGFLTQQYLRGRRTRYIRPLRFYLLSSIIFFALFALRVDPSADAKTVPAPENSDAVTSAAELDSVAADKTRLGNVSLPAGIAIPDSVLADFEQNDSGVDSDSVNLNIDFGESSNLPFIGEYLQRQQAYVESLPKDELLERFLTQMMRHAPKVIFVLMPFVALTLKLLYVRRSRYYMEHFIFALHWHSFLFILLSFALFFPQWWLKLFLFLSAPVYLFIALRRVYQQSWLRTYFKHTLVLWSYFLMGSLGAFALALASALTV